MKLPSFKDLKITNQKVLLRTNYDVPLTSDGRVGDETRIEETLPTINYLLAQKAKLIIITHLSRPGGKPVPGLSLKSVVERLKTMLSKKTIYFSQEILGEKTKRLSSSLKPGEILVLENLRFDPGEEENDFQFAKSLAGLADFYINEAFACSHRKHASIVTLPELLPSALGFDCLEEIETLTKIKEKPKRPLVIILGGVKKSKFNLALKLLDWADFILIGGKLVAYDGVFETIEKHKKIIGDLKKEGEDISQETIKKFKEVIKQAKTIIWSGPLGAYEEKRFEKGTKEIAQAAVDSQAFFLVGGGDTEAALSKFHLEDKIDFVSSGGGAMLAFLTAGTLPGIEAIKKNNNKIEQKARQ